MSVRCGNLSVVIKTSLLYAIMVTGAIWKRSCLDAIYLPSLFQRRSQHVGMARTRPPRDVVGRLGIAHGANVGGFAAYASYVVNALQFIEVSGGETTTVSELTTGTAGLAGQGALES